MLKEYLNQAMGVLDELIALTDEDIKNIKEAKHSTVEESVKKKNELVKKFESVKILLDKELLRASKESGGADLASILDDEVKSNLEKLHSKNKEYARYVLMVKEFFDGLVSAMFKGQNGDNGYSKSKPSPETLLKTRV